MVSSIQVSVQTQICGASFDIYESKSSNLGSKDRQLDTKIVGQKFIALTIL